MCFRAAIPPDNIIFDHEIAMDLLWFDGMTVLHTVYTHTFFQNAEIATSKTAEGLWRRFLNSWVTMYLGYPTTIWLYHEALFNYVPPTLPQPWFHMQRSGVESHNSIRVGERYIALRAMISWLATLGVQQNPRRPSQARMQVSTPTSCKSVKRYARAPRPSTKPTGVWPASCVAASPKE